MKVLNKVLCAVLALVMLAAVFCSCGKDKGVLLATYDGGKVYSEDDDLKNWTSYLYGIYYDYIEEGTLTSTDVAKRAVETVIRIRLSDKELKRLGLKVTNDDIKEMYEYNKLNFNEYYNDGEDGYETMKKDTGLGDDFWMEFAKNAAVESVIENKLLTDYEITEEKLTTYYNSNYDKYIINAGYEYTAVFVEVLDLSSEAEWTEKKAAAQSYIDRIKAGEKFETVSEEILKKYTEEAGYTLMHTYSGEGSLNLENVTEVKNLENDLAALDKKYSDRSSDSTSGEAYETYLKYLIECYNLETSFALKLLGDGMVYSQPITAPFGWMIFRRDKLNPETRIPTLDEVRYEVTGDYLDSLSEEGTLMEEYIADVITRYNVVFESFSVS